MAQIKSYWCPSGCGKKVVYQDYYYNFAGEIKGIHGMNEEERKDIGSLNPKYNWKCMGHGFICNNCHQRFNSIKELI